MKQVDKSISWFGSWSEDDQIGECIPQLTGLRLQRITSAGRSPELKIRLSDNTWVLSFSTVEGHTRWALLFPEQIVVTSERGKLLKSIERYPGIDDHSMTTGGHVQ